MEVELIACTPEPDVMCAAAAKLCHEPDDRPFLEVVSWLRDNLDHVQRVLRQVIKMGHLSVIEHANFTFYIGDVSRAMTHQLVRHRIASYSQQSQRYVDMDDFSYVVPPSIGEDAYLRANFRECMDAVRRYHKTLRDSNVKKEDARFMIPNACTTKIFVTMNARSLYNFFELRLSKHAQWEIRQVAGKMYAQVKKVAPMIFEKFESPELYE